ncbi:MAG: exodeoxyribonuclease VII small subunit [Sulfurospirillaceae bacterium]|nr:exodeoxyribonuclease VII small subunit [Sulfurospirillaceae bacterium]
MAKNTDKTVSFEQKLETAKDILNTLSNPELSLEDGMKKYQEGIRVLQEATQMIESAKLEYERLQQGEKS